MKLSTLWWIFTTIPYLKQFDISISCFSKHARWPIRITLPLSMTTKQGVKKELPSKHQGIKIYELNSSNFNIWLNAEYKRDWIVVHKLLVEILYKLTDCFIWFEIWKLLFLILGIILLWGNVRKRYLTRQWTYGKEFLIWKHCKCDWIICERFE